MIIHFSFYSFCGIISIIRHRHNFRVWLNHFRYTQKCRQKVVDNKNELLSEKGKLIEK